MKLRRTLMIVLVSALAACQAVLAPEQDIAVRNESPESYVIRLVDSDGGEQDYEVPAMLSVRLPRLDRRASFVILYSRGSCTSLGGFDFELGGVAPRGVLAVDSAGKFEFDTQILAEAEIAKESSTCVWVTTHNPFK